MRRILGYILFLLCPLFVWADGSMWWNTDYNTTEGTEFYVTFMRNGGAAAKDEANLSLYLYATSRENSTITIINPYDNSTIFSQSVNKGEQAKIKVPNNYLAYAETPEKSEYVSLLIKSTRPISLYSTAHHTSGMYDGSNILPIKALSNCYMIDTYLFDKDATEFAVIATQDQEIYFNIKETTISQEEFQAKGKIVPIDTTESTFSIYLYKGQTYLYRATSNMGSLSGSYVSSDKPFVLFQGGQNVSIPAGDQNNNIYHQAYPVSDWGRTFYVTPTHGTVYDFVHLTACTNDTKIYRNGTLLCTLNAQETYQDTIKSVLEYLTVNDLLKNTPTFTPTLVKYTSSKEISCFLYSSINNFNHPFYGEEQTEQTAKFGASTLTPIIPQEGALKSCQFATFSDISQIEMHHYINVVVKTSEVSGMRLDNQSISSEFEPIPDDPTYSYMIKEIMNKTTTDAHFIENTRNNVDSKFTMRVYGLGQGNSGLSHESYAYSAGSRITKDASILLNDKFVKSVSVCQNGDPVKVTSVINYDYDDIEWQFHSRDSVNAPKEGLNGTITSNAKNHLGKDSIFSKVWEEPGTDTILMIIKSHQPLCKDSIYDTVKVYVNVLAIQHQYKTQNICYGEDVTITLDGSGQTATFKGDTITPMQDGSYAGQTFKLNKMYEFSYIVTQETGCDQHIHQRVTIRPTYDLEYTVHICDDEIPYTFGDNKGKLANLTKDGTYTDNLKTKYGCDSIVTLNLFIHPTVQLTTEDLHACQSSGSYTWISSDGVEHKLEDSISLLNSGTFDYTDTLSTEFGCNKIYSLHLTVDPVSHTSETASICSGQSYSWHNKQLTESGTYYDTLKSVVCGCDSIVQLELTVTPTYNQHIDVTWCSNNGAYNHPNADASKLQNLTKSGTYVDTLPSICNCDSIITLHLTVITVQDTTIYASTCSNEPYPFNGELLTKSGEYTMLESIGAECTRTVTLHLEVYPTFDITLRDTICAGDTCYWENSTYTKAGIYHKDYKTIHGCDSIMKLELTVNDTFHTYIDTTWCSDNDIYNHPDERATKFQNLTETGIYIDTIPTIHGCDSILTLNLKVIAVVDTTIYDTICSNETYLFGKEKLNKTGTYHREDTIGGSCYRIVTLELEVFQAYDSLLRDTICAGETYYWEDSTYTKTGIYHKDYKTIHGCDSVMKLELTVMPNYSKQIDVTWCSNEGPYNHPDKRADNLQNRTETGTYIDTIPTIYGCDSILTLNLKVIAVADTTIHDTICSNEYREFNGKQLNETGIYTMPETIGTSCSRIVTLQLVVYPAYDITTRDTICAGDTCYWEGSIYTKAGSYHKDYKTIHGCDSIMKLELTVMPNYSKQIDVTWCSNEGPYNHPDKRADNLQNRTETGTYIDTIPTIYGCDSILTLNLKVIAVADTTIHDTICSNEYREFNGKQLNKTGIYTMPETIGTSCSRIVTLQLVVYPAYDITTRDTICAGDTCYWEGSIYTKAGSYHKDYKTIHGCDSVMKLELTVMPTYDDPVVYDEWCAEDGPYNYFDKRADKFQGLTKTGEYKDTLQTIYGCDSIITLDLKVWPNYVLSDTTRVSICDNEPYHFQGIIYNQHSEWKTADHSIRHDTLFGSGKSIHGCDSSFVHIVTTYPTYEFVSTQQICSGDTVYWEGHTLTQTNIYEELKQTIYGCDSLLVLNLYAKPVVRKKRYLSGCEDTVFTHYDTIRNGSREVIMPTTLWDPYTNPQDVILHKEHTELVDVSFPSKDGTCDSIVYEYHIHLFPTYIDEKEATFCSNEMYPINSVHEVGIDTLFDYRDNVLPIDTTYRDTLQTITGCDSVFVLKAHILPASIHKQQDSICFGEELNWCEQIIQKGSGEYQYPNAGDYIFRYTYEKENGCDSIIELHLTVMPTYIDSIYQEWCSKDGAYNYPCAQALKLQQLTETGVYRDTLLAISGCDSILVVNLHIFNNEDIEMYDTICSNDFYEFDGKQITESGTYQKTEQLPNGCPQTTILNLTVYPAYEDTTEVTICYGDTCFWEDSTYTIEGEYIEHKYTIHGCDSILHLLLFIEPDYNTYTTDSICQGEQYLFDDEWINEQGDYVHSHNSILGCDSSHYMTLIVFDTVATFDTTTICNNEPYDFYGQTITEEGTYRKSSLTEHGCSLNNYLTVYVIPPTIAHVSVEPLCADQEAFEVDFTYEGTQPIAYSLLYDSIGHSQGFVDIRHQLLESDSVIVVATPFRDDDTTKYPRPDHYPITLILHNGICQNDSLYPSQTDIIMNYPSWVTEQRFGDLIAILNDKYNGGYTFDKYQWFENGQMMIGETRPYLYLPHKLELVEYYVELTRTGETESFQTCPILIVPDQLDTIAPRLPYISVTPTYISSENPKANILSWTPGRYVITDVMGNRLMEGDYTPDSHNAYEIDVPSIPNIYVIYMEETDAGIYSQIPHEKNRSQKIIVY